MLQLHYWPTPNGHKVAVFLEEAGLPYEIVPVDIGAGDQFRPEFLAVAPNNRIPALVDDAPADGGPQLSVFESGAILLYLAEKTGRFLPADLRGRTATLEWLMWQMGGLGPMLGQNHHFRKYAPEPIPYAVRRYTDEARRLYNVLNRRLRGRDFICGEHTVADMACYPWTVSHERQGIDLADFPEVRRWFEAMRARPAVVRAYAKAKEVHAGETVDEKAKSILFGQTDTCAPGGGTTDGTGGTGGTGEKS